MTSTIETLTDLTSLKLIEKSCQYFTTNAKRDLSSQQRNQAINLAAFDEYESEQREIERKIAGLEAELDRYILEHTQATETVTKLQAQVAMYEASEATFHWRDMPLNEWADGPHPKYFLPVQ